MYFATIRWCKLIYTCVQGHNMVVQSVNPAAMMQMAKASMMPSNWADRLAVDPVATRSVDDDGVQLWVSSRRNEAWWSSAGVLFLSPRAWNSVEGTKQRRL